jgi:ArsR family transcriptional regulator
VRDLDLRDKADLLRQLAHPTRLLILEVLSGGARCVTELQCLLNLPQTNVSQHLCVLRQARMVDFHESGNLRSYYLSRPSLAKALLQVLSGQYGSKKRDPGFVPREGNSKMEETSCNGFRRGAPVSALARK